MKKNYYELTYIINPVLQDEEFDSIIDKVTELVRDNEGEIDEVDRWGVRNLAFEMQGKSSGYYVNMYFNAPGTLIEKLERSLRLEDNVLRYLTLKYDAKMLRHREQQRRDAVPQVFVDEDEDEDSDEEE